MELSLTELLTGPLVVGIRISGLMLFAPFFGNGAIPPRIKAILVLLVTAVLYPAYSIQVGMVTGTSLNRDATAARVHLLIEPRYAHLVRIGSRFWTTSGVDVSLSLFKGVQISVDSLRSLVAGGIAFATGFSSP